jgi:hypothetical protein
MSILIGDILSHTSLLVSVLVAMASSAAAHILICSHTFPPVAVSTLEAVLCHHLSLFHLLCRLQPASLPSESPIDLFLSHWKQIAFLKHLVLFRTPDNRHSPQTQ